MLLPLLSIKNHGKFVLIFSALQVCVGVMPIYEVKWEVEINQHCWSNLTRKGAECVKTGFIFFFVSRFGPCLPGGHNSLSSLCTWRLELSGRFIFI